MFMVVVMVVAMVVDVVVAVDVDVVVVVDMVVDMVVVLIPVLDLHRSFLLVSRPMSSHRHGLRPHLLAPLLALASATPLVATPATPARPITLDDLARVRDIAEVQRSPDGAWVAYTVTTTDVEKDERGADVWMSRWDGSEQVRLTSSADDESAPRWSPDGRWLAFLATRGDEKEKKKGKQVWLLNRAGGEAERLTEMPGGVSDYAWSPDSTRLVLVADDPDPDDEPEKKPGWKRKTAPPIVITRYFFKDDDSGYRKNLYAHLYVFDMKARKAVAITTGPFDDSEPAWSPDGTRIAFVSERGTADPDRENNSDIFLVQARAGAKPVRLTTWAGPDSGPPVWSPDGSMIAYRQGQEPRFSAYNLEALAVVPAAGGPPRLLCPDLDRSVSSVVWSSDGRALLFVVEDDRARQVAQVSVKGGQVGWLTVGRRVVSEISPSVPGAEGWAVVAGTATQPDEVCTLSSAGLRQITHHNDSWLAAVELAGAEDVTFTANDGTVVNGLLSRPAGFREDRRYPALLNVHGGPDGQDEHSFDFEREWLAASGYVVLQVNYRGSSGRGAAFQKAIFGDWGHLEVVDLLAGADFLAHLPFVDPDRLGIGGWSYGGILTNYTIATDQRFKAAVSGAGSSLQTTMYGVDEYIEQYDAELGPPWKSEALWLKVSYPFFHADRIRTPTLFLGGADDFNVPLVGGEQMYQALRGVGVDSQLVIYPDQHHILSLPSYRRDRLARSVAWYDRNLKPTRSKP
jgi:dipeptidyl aminopeptidase/acylaminoacyl peptidase